MSSNHPLLPLHSPTTNVVHSTAGESFCLPLAAGLTSPSPHVHRSFWPPFSQEPEWFFYKRGSLTAYSSGWSPNMVPAAALLGLCPFPPRCLCPHSIMSSGPLTALLPLPNWPLPLLQARGFLSSSLTAPGLPLMVFPQAFSYTSWVPLSGQGYKNKPECVHSLLPFQCSCSALHSRCSVSMC